MTTEDPIEEARRLLAELDGEWEYKKGRDHWDVHSKKKRGSAWVCEVFDKRDAEFIAAAPRLLEALCDRLEAAEMALGLGATDVMTADDIGRMERE